MCCFWGTARCSWSCGCRGLDYALLSMVLVTHMFALLAAGKLPYLLLIFVSSASCQQNCLSTLQPVDGLCCAVSIASQFDSLWTACAVQPAGGFKLATLSMSTMHVQVCDVCRMAGAVFGGMPLRCHVAASGHSSFQLVPLWSLSVATTQ